MGLFQKNQPVGVQLSQKQIYENNYNGTRGNILLVVLFTAINIVLLISNSNKYFLFSAFIPYALFDVGRYICGMYPSEYYDGMQYMTFYQKEVFVVMLIVAVVILVVYTLCWVFSKKLKVGWLITALVFFVLDTVAMFLVSGFMTESLVDYLIHAWIIFSLSSGIYAYVKWKKAPEEVAQPTGCLVVESPSDSPSEHPAE